MPSRNERCPCGSASKFKRCCLPRIDAVAGELRDRDALLAKLIDWVSDEHAETLEAAARETMLVRVLRGRTGRSMSSAWALGDFAPADGGPPLMSRFAAKAELDSAEREIARGLATARLDAYHVCSAVAGATIELASLTDIEVARVIVGEHELSAVSADHDALGSLVGHIERSMGSLIAPLRRAA